jgi:hypothetical protein
MARLNRERFPDPNVPPPGSTAVTYGDGLEVASGSVVQVDFGTGHEQAMRGDTAVGGSSPLTTDGDLYVRAGGVDARLPIGTTGQVLTVSSGLAAWRSLPWASHTSMSVQTTNGTQTTCGSYTTTSNSAVTIKLLVTGLKSDFTASCGWELTLTARNAGGTVTIEGGGAIIVGPTDSATTWSVTVDASGADVRLRVTGAAATTIDWTARWIVG